MSSGPGIYFCFLIFIRLHVSYRPIHLSSDPHLFSFTCMSFQSFLLSHNDSRLQYSGRGPDFSRKCFETVDFWVQTDTYDRYKADVLISGWREKRAWVGRLDNYHRDTKIKVQWELPFGTQPRSGPKPCLHPFSSVAEGAYVRCRLKDRTES